jgi:hypothetical protein
MYRNDLDLLSLPEDIDLAPPGENAPSRVLSEMGLVLMATLSLAALLTMVFGH